MSNPFTTKRRYTRPYVTIDRSNGLRKVYRSAQDKAFNLANYVAFGYDVYGPFHTARAARWFAAQPSIDGLTVSKAEREARALFA